MGVYIKDMEMPQNCEECDLKVWDEYDDVDYVCPFSGVIVLNIGRQGSCPLVEVPPHGRLIEKNAVFKLIQSMPSVDKLLPVEFMKALQEIPTVILAEEGE